MELKHNLNDAMAVGGLPLGKWKANHEDLLHREPGEPKPKLEEGYTKVLGVHWCPKRDQFAFKVDMSKLAFPARTPRQLVSVQCSLYDPNGFVSPFIFLGRKMLQLATAGRRGWDSPLHNGIFFSPPATYGVGDNEH